MSFILAIVLAATPAPPPTLVDLASRLASSGAWQADFVQEFVPTGFEAGSQDSGTLLLAPPSRLRFDYGSSGRIFAVSGSIARHVDVPAGVCDAVALSTSVWSRLPLATLLDPGATMQMFAVDATPGGLRLLPREPMPEMEAIHVTLGPDGHVARIETIDESGNRSVFRFSGWKPVRAPVPSHFQPSLPGQEPCQPEAS